MSAATDYDTALQAVATALGTADYATARKQLAIAEAHALRLPQSTSAGGVTTTERATEALGKLRERIDQEEQRTAGPFFLMTDHWALDT